MYCMYTICIAGFRGRVAVGRLTVKSFYVFGVIKLLLPSLWKDRGKINPYTNTVQYCACFPVHHLSVRLIVHNLIFTDMYFIMTMGIS